MMDRREMLRTSAAATAGALLPLSTARAGSAPAPRLGVRRAHERGHANHGWLDTRHTFSFAQYHDPRWMGFRSLRVINEDRVEPGRGFGLHPHQDMEILTWVLDGALEHRDTLGNGSIIRPGDAQRMSAGTGIRHSEFNPSGTDPVHFLQIWILPEARGVAPAYAQRSYDAAERAGTLRLLASRDGRDGSLSLHQDANVWAGLLEEGRAVAWQNPAGRHVWLQVARGGIEVAGERLDAGDGAWTSDEGALTLRGRSPAEVLLFDLA